MSLSFNWVSRSLLRRCLTYTSTTTSGFRKVSMMTSSVSLPKRSLPLTITSTSPLAMSLSSHYVWTSLRFKSGVKTNSGCKKRFRVRGSGSIKRWVSILVRCCTLAHISKEYHHSNHRFWDRVSWLSRSHLPYVLIHIFTKQTSRPYFNGMNAWLVVFAAEGNREKATIPATWNVNEPIA